ncbi:unnamed protein product [Didymodactylos carnosus]|uniref:Uncharacterized protein n=1 Tax=Didymodactylos carnosus TaxID=1234261 RepID=A0A8S2EZ60_9BILA|nr:unnamed protein product [Didymodactylos carnosus]CAF4083636.1 unnamed protein product [Didymodactylos carnosus]
MFDPSRSYKTDVKQYLDVVYHSTERELIQCIEANEDIIIYVILFSDQQKCIQKLHTYRQVKEIHLLCSNNTETTDLKEDWTSRNCSNERGAVFVSNMDKLKFQLIVLNLEYCINKLDNDPTMIYHKQVGTLANQLTREIESRMEDNEGQQEARQNQTKCCHEKQQERSEDQTNNEGQPK